MVRSGKLYSPGKPYVSYALPALAKVKGCKPQGPETIDCRRPGGVLITIQGQYFGSKRAKVVVGGEICANVKHNATVPNRELSCVIPAGVQLDRAVQVFARLHSFVLSVCHGMDLSCVLLPFRLYCFSLPFLSATVAVLPSRLGD